MTVKEVKNIVNEAASAKENSVDDSFADILQNKMEDFLSKVTNIMGKSIDELPVHKKVPKEIEDAANELHSCHAIWLYYQFLFPGFPGFFSFLENTSCFVTLFSFMRLIVLSFSRIVCFK